MAYRLEICIKCLQTRIAQPPTSINEPGLRVGANRKHCWLLPRHSRGLNTLTAAQIPYVRVALELRIPPQFNPATAIIRLGWHIEIHTLPEIASSYPHGEILSSKE
jgi:hypothetical protein